LIEALLSAADVGQLDSQDVIVTNIRHVEALSKSRDALNRALNGIATGLTGDFISQDIRESMHYLGEITGMISTDEVLGNIFAKFCIGK